MSKMKVADLRGVMFDRTISLFSVPYNSKRIYAFVPGDSGKGITRLKLDDPIWEREPISFHWTYSVDRNARVRPRQRIKFVVA